MVKPMVTARFAKPQKHAKQFQDSEEIVKMATKENSEVEELAPHFAIRHPDLREFWERCVGKDEVAWDTFWLHFPTGLAPEVFVDSAFSSQKERTTFQEALHVAGAPEHINVSMLDAAFPPGCPLGVTTARLQKSGARRLLRDADSEKRMAASTKVTGKHRSLGLQGAGFWDEAPTTLASLAALAAEVEAELSFADGQRSTVAQVLGHVGSGPASVAADAAARLLAKGFWSTAVRVGMKGARSAEVAAARVAAALNILSYPVVTDELLRLTAFFHTRAESGGRMGLVLDAEGCVRADEVHALSVLVTTVFKAGGSNVQMIVAGEGALQLASSVRGTTVRVPTPPKAEGTAFLEASVRSGYLGGSGAAVAAACGHQAALMKLAAATLQTGLTTPQALVNAICAASPLDSHRGGARGQPTRAVVEAAMATLPEAERDFLYRLSMLPHGFTAAAAAKVLGQKDTAETSTVLASLVEKGFLRGNMVLGLFGVMPSASAVLRREVQQPSAVASLEAAVVALVEYSLELAETAAALNASNAQVAGMRVIDREREVFDEMVNLLQDCHLLPAVTTALYGELVSKHMDLLGFRLSLRQQQELCVACAHASRAEGDMLAEARCLQHLEQARDLQAADAAMARAMATVEKALTPSHPVIADMLLSWARLQSQAGNHHQAERLLRKSLHIQLCQGSDKGKSMAVAATQTRLAGELIALAAPERARPHLQAALDTAVKQLGPHHPDTALAQCRLASCLADLREFEGAYYLYSLALDGWRKSLGHCHPQFATLLGQLAFCCCRLRKRGDAEQYYRRSIQMWKEMMVLDQQELQDDLRALADLLHQQGRAEECAEIREQLHRLGEAVKAAHARAVRKAEPSRGLKKVLLMPLKALCMPTQRAPAFVALPHGIQDSDLEELRKATNPQIALEVNATGLSGAHVAAAADGEKAEVVAAEKSSTPAAKDEKQESLQASGPRAKAEVQGASGESKAGRSLTLPVASLQSTGELSYDSPPGSAGSSRHRQLDRSTGQAKEALAAQPAAPFGTKGRGPTTVEGSVWAASLRNPAIALGSSPKRISTLSGTRNDSSGTKSRLFTTTNEARQGSARDITCGLPKSQMTGQTDQSIEEELIRAHTVEEKAWMDGTLSRQASNASEQARNDRRETFSSDSTFASNDTLAGGAPLGEDTITHLTESSSASRVEKSVIGFYNPMFMQTGVSRTSSQATTVMTEAQLFDEKVEV